MIRQIWNT